MNKELRQVMRDWSRSLTTERVIKELLSLAYAIDDPDGAYLQDRAEVAGTPAKALRLDDPQVYAVLVSAAARLKELDETAKEHPTPDT
jgi:hypothetical protein